MAGSAAGATTVLPPGLPICGVLLAAGSGSRFDPQRLAAKLQARIDGEPMAVLAARSLRQTHDLALAVIRPEWHEDPALRALAEAIREEGLTLITCADASQGMGHSLSFGVREAVTRHRPEVITIALADMPRISPATYRRLQDQLFAQPAPRAAIVAPTYRGRRGHPVLFGAAHFEALSTLRGDQGASSILKQHPVHLVEVDDPGVLADIDTLADLANVAERQRHDDPAAPPR